MLQRVEVKSYAPTLPLPIGGGATDDPIQIRNIDGLGPVKAALASTPYATGRGAYFQGGNTPERNIVMTLGLNPDWTTQTVAELRKLLYGYFMPEQWCELRFFADEYPDVKIEGICESVEPNIFSQDPEIQVSIINHHPDFVEIESVSIDGEVTGALVSGEPTEYEIEYDGSTPVGFVLEVRATDANPSYSGRLAIVNESFDQVQTFELDDVTIDATHYVLLGTLENARRIVSIDTGTNLATDLLGQAIVSRDWIQLQPGENVLAVSAEEADLEFNLLYFTRYGGL